MKLSLLFGVDAGIIGLYTFNSFSTEEPFALRSLFREGYGHIYIYIDVDVSKTCCQMGIGIIRFVQETICIYYIDIAGTISKYRHVST